MNATAAEWTERVRAWRASGLSASEFSKPFGYRGKTLCWWASELKRREHVKNPANDAAKVTMARVRLTRQSAEADLAPISIAVGGAQIAVRRGFDAALLREVVSALGAIR